MFNGRLKVTVLAAQELQHTNYMTRHPWAMASSNAASSGGSAAAASAAAATDDDKNVDGGGGESGEGGGGENIMNSSSSLDPYVQIDVDEVFVERTMTRGKTRDPQWHETFTTDLLRNANTVGFIVWHDANLPPDDFIANCVVNLADLVEKEEQPVHDLWVSEHLAFFPPSLFFPIGRTCKRWISMI